MSPLGGTSKCEQDGSATENGKFDENDETTTTMKTNATVTDAKLDAYFAITGEALEKARNACDDSTNERARHAADFLDMAQRYHDDAQHFRAKGDKVLAFAALNYAHGWLDAGARIGLFTVKDSRLFTVDDE